jgi:hypothetical protein
MARQLTENTLMQALNWTYDKAVNGIPGLDSAEELASDYMKGSPSLTDKANSLIRWQNGKAASAGFLSGLGGVLSLPIAIPANIGTVMYVQVRMIAAIAYMGGHNVHDDRVKSLVFACLAGDAAKDVLKDMGIVIGSKMATKAIENISGKTIIAINKKVGFRLLTKFGEKGAINLGKAVPVLGGFIGGAVDLTTTNIIGNVARDTFICAR